MTNREAIEILKMEVTKARTDFYPDRIRALEKAINALYEVSDDADREIPDMQGSDKSDAVLLADRL